MKYIFLDRDGVINKDPGGWTPHSYVTEWSQFCFLPGVFEALKLLHDNKFRVIIISNQAGVGKGYFTRSQLDTVTRRMVDEVRRLGGDIEAAFYCLHKKEDACDCRKPKPGLLKMAARRYKIDLPTAYFIGDTEADVIAGRTVGVKTVFVASGKASEKEALSWDTKPDYLFKDLAEAVQWIVTKDKRKAERAFRREKERR